MGLADILVTAGGSRSLALMGATPLLGTPVPLWNRSHLEDAAMDVMDRCQNLPWIDPGRDKAVCTYQIVRHALLSFAGRPSSKVLQQQTPRSNASLKTSITNGSK